MNMGVHRRGEEEPSQQSESSSSVGLTNTPAEVTLPTSSLGYSVSLMESYFKAKKLVDNKFHKILFVTGPILGFLVAFICFYMIFIGVTDQSNKIFEKKDLEIQSLQKTANYYRRLHEANRESIIHEKYEDSRVLSEELSKCQQTQSETIQDIVGLKETLQQTKMNEKMTLDNFEMRHKENIKKKNDRILALLNELKMMRATTEDLSKTKYHYTLTAISLLIGIIFVALCKPTSHKLY